MPASARLLWVLSSDHGHFGSECPAGARNRVCDFWLLEPYMQSGEADPRCLGSASAKGARVAIAAFAPSGPSQCVCVIFSPGDGLAPDRVHFVDWMKGADYFSTYHRIDIALDPFPYGGGTTTCDALWMGVPVVSLAGPQTVSRAGLSLLANVQLQELVAYNVEGYVQIAMDLAGNLPRLSTLRAGAPRNQMRSSPLMDTPRFAEV